MIKRSYKEHLAEIGIRIKQYRVNLGMTQQDLEDRSGVSLRSISRLEQGASVQLESLIKILIALNLGENISMLIPDQTKRPSYYLKENSQRQRVRKKEKPVSGFKWGDEE